MIRQQTELGEIKVGSNVYTNIAGNAATSCFGVKGMAIRSVTDGLVHLLRKESMAKGVLVRTNDDGTISIELHIIIDQGVNIPALGASIISEVRYIVSKQTETEVREVNVIVDSIVTD